MKTDFKEKCKSVNNKPEYPTAFYLKKTSYNIIMIHESSSRLARYENRPIVLKGHVWFSPLLFSRK